MYLILAILSSVCVSLVMRLSESKVKSNIGMLTMNYILCCVFASNFQFHNCIPNLSPTFFMSVINGFFYVAGFVALQYNIQKNGLVYSSMFMKLGIMIPIVISFLIYKEIPTLFQIVGLILALSMIVFMNYTDQSIPFLPGLILLLVMGGSGDAMSKVFQMTGKMDNSAFFLFYTFFFAFVLCFLFMKYKKQSIGKDELLYGCLIGIPNFYSAKFLLYALTQFPSIIVYPTYSILTICILGLAGVLFFKEKIEKRTWFAMTFMLVAIGLLNM